MAKFTSGALATCALALFAYSGQAYAAEGEQPAASDDGTQLGEIVVMAQKRSEKLTDVPITITSVPVSKLEDANLNSVFTLNQVVPGLRIDNASGYIQPSIRGVGNSIAGTGFSNNVATYVDGFYIASQNAANAKFLNVESVNVLKGPQGTLFGRNATGGAILIRLREPQQTPTFELRQSYARFDSMETDVYASAGLTDNIAFSIGGMYERGDGFTRNILPGSSFNDKYENWNLRATVLLEPAEGVKFKLAYEHSEENDGRPSATNIWIDPATGNPQGLAVLLGQVYATKRDEVSNSFSTELVGRHDAAYLTSTFELGNATLTSYTMYQEQKTINNIDLDGSIELLEGHFDLQNKSFTQEINLAGKTGNLDYVVGVFAYKHKEHQGPFPLTFGAPLLGGNPGDPGLTLDPLYTANTDTQAYAVFADGTYGLNDRLFLTLGARYSYEKEKAGWFCPTLSAAFGSCPAEPDGGPHAEFSNSWKSFTPRAVLRYEPSPNSSIYASYSKGFKSGAVTPNSFSETPLKPENIDAFEIGYKYSGPTLRLAGSIYYYDYRNLQIAYYVNGTGRYLNAANSEIYGAELEATAIVAQGLEASFGVNYNHAKYKNFDVAPFWGLNPPNGAYATTPVSAAGKQMQRSPEWSGNFALNYATDLAGGRFKASSNLAFTSSFSFDPHHQFEQKGYALLSGTVSWTEPSDHFTFSVFGTNLTDQTYYTQFNPGGMAILVRYGEPRVIGGRISVKY